MFCAVRKMTSCTHVNAHLASACWSLQFGERTAGYDKDLLGCWSLKQPKCMNQRSASSTWGSRVKEDPKELDNVGASTINWALEYHAINTFFLKEPL